LIKQSTPDRPRIATPATSRRHMAALLRFVHHLRPRAHPSYTCFVERNQNIGPLYAIRLGDLREWHVVVATCSRCRHVGSVSLARLQRGRRGALRLVDLQPRLCCRRCGNRVMNTLTVTRRPRD